MSTTDAIKTEVKLGFALYSAWAAAKADGKLGLDDLGQLLTLIGPINDAYSARLQVGGQFAQLDEAGLADLAAYVVTETGAVAGAATTAKVVAVVAALKANYEAVLAFKST